MSEAADTERRRALLSAWMEAEKAYDAVVSTLFDAQRPASPDVAELDRLQRELEAAQRAYVQSWEE